VGKIKGLFKRALQLRITNKDDTVLSEQTIVLDDESGISKEDQKEIIQEINKIASKSKIKVTPELFHIKALKQGFGLPILVNALATVVLTISILGLIVLFKGERDQIISAGSVEAIQGVSIVEKLKQQAEEDLKRKNQEILDIQNNLSQVNNELDDLKTNMEERIAEREDELRLAMAAEIESEKQRLREAGYTGSDLDAQLEAFTAKKDAEYQTLFEDYKKQEQAKIAALEQSKREYAVRLEQAQEELKATEEELKSKQSEIEREVALLKEQKEKLDVINNQILGYYKSIKTQMSNNNLNNAKTQLAGLRSYLNDPNVISHPDILARQDVEIFIIDSLERLIVKEQQKGSVDTESLIASADLVTEIRASVIEANRAYKAGNKAKAEEYYLNALKLIPEVYQSHNYFMGKIEDVESYREAQVDKYVSLANTQFANKQFSQALENYTRAIEFLPGDQNTQRIITNIRYAGYYVAEDKSQQTSSTQAQKKLDQAKSLINQKKYNDAINVLLTLIRDYPRSIQVDESLTLISKAIKLKDEEVKSNVAVIGSESSQNQAALQDYKNEITALQQSLKEKDAELASLKEKANLKQGTTIVDEQELKMLETIAEDLRNAQSTYYAYRQAEDRIIRRGTTKEYVEGKSYLDEFLASDKMENIFPGLISRIKRYDIAFEEMGRESALKYTTSIIDQLTGFTTTGERLSFIDQKIKEESRDPHMVTLLRSLKRLLSE
jgi:hypothetical protein